ncbi:MAG TPA: hypothetical protein VFG73_09650 [Rhodanobacteraceae bacterium]|nr:hypothetical protein [Rhodanobacteraceae bacterium]
MKHDTRPIPRLLGVGLIAVVAATSVHAEGTMVAQCGRSGADFVLSDVTPADASMVYGLPAAPGDDAVLVVDELGGAHWSTDSRSAIDTECGGDGSNEINLFTPIQPRDGTWRMEMVNHRTLGCSSRIAGAAKAAVARKVGQDTTHVFDFQQPFHPHPLMDATWMQTGTNRWQSQIVHQGSEAMTMDVAVRAKVISPSQINETSTFTIRMSPQLARIMGGSGNCRSIANFKLTWVK